MSALTPYVAEQLLRETEQQLWAFKRNMGDGPTLIKPVIEVRRLRQPEQRPMWRVDLYATFRTDSGRLLHGGWPAVHWDLAEALIRAGNHAERLGRMLLEEARDRG